MATDKDHDLLNEFLEQRRHEESLHSHGKGRRAQHRSGGGDVMYHPDDWQPLWLLGRARDAKGFEDGSTAQRFRPSRLYSVDYAFGYLVGYAWKTGQRVDWGAVMRSCNRLDRAKAGDFSM